MKREEKNKKSTTEIITAAIRLYAKAGNTNISLNELCRENKISKGKFYHYFSSKDDLFMVTVSYIVDDMCQDINSFYTDRNKSLEDNLKGYYAARVKYWLSHPDHFVIIYNLRSNLRSNSNYELKTQFLPLKEKFSSALDNKTIEIIHTANVEKNIPDDELLEVLRVIYDNMFLIDMHKIIAAYTKGETAHAQKLSADLLGLYSRLINVLLYGILAKKTPED
ncbi:MAG TPA: TetR/AcrR family transcriptional regulator [Candidatus Eubacterium faecale]|uniref:TetR/AcrR family transcriptional regulator n=1 Tax=Candidatus Eubacterium faecale TaxID=2838568 RepID=A0A9D2S937_9FIRM|nr:TetR/AcrR family transcriptional regulator [Candidatus Eubacterium faecale]